MVYCAIHHGDNKVYVGQTKFSLQHRMNEHRWSSQRSYFHSALKKYGPGSFDWCILTPSDESAASTDEWEIYWIFALRANDPRYGYNLTIGGGGASGFKHSLESRRRLSLRMMGNTHPLGCHRDNRGEKNPRAKLSFTKADEIRTLYATGKFLQSELATRFNVNQQSISNVIRGITWAVPQRAA